MTKEEHKKLADQFKQNRIPFKVTLFFCKTSTNQHAFAISTPEGKIGVGLPTPRQMTPVETFTEEHRSRKPEWEQAIIDGRLYWAPVTDGKTKSEGRFFFVEKDQSENKPESFVEACDDGSSKIMEMSQPKISPTKHTREAEGRTF